MPCRRVRHHEFDVKWRNLSLQSNPRRRRHRRNSLLWPKLTHHHSWHMRWVKIRAFLLLANIAFLHNRKLIFFFFFFFFKRRTRRKRAFAASAFAPPSPISTCEQSTNEAAALLPLVKRSLRSHLAAASNAAAAAAATTAVSSTSVLVCNDIQLPSWRLTSDFVPHPATRSTKAMASSLRALLTEPVDHCALAADVDDEADYAVLHGKFELRERIVRALWIASLPLRIQAVRDPRGEYKQVLYDHPDAVALIVAENRLRVPARLKAMVSANAATAPPSPSASPSPSPEPNPVVGRRSSRQR
jgi:hypothetical protein